MPLKYDKIFPTLLRNRLDADFSKDVSKLTLGTFAGRLLALAALPFLTRLYTPEDFATLAVYLALVNTIAVAACFRFDVAIPLAENDSDALHLLVLSLFFLSSVTLISLLLLLAIPTIILNWLGNPEIASYLFLIPVGIGIAGIYAALQSWAARERSFSSLAFMRVGQSLTGVSTMLGLGWLGVAPLGLLIGNMLINGAGGLYLIVKTLFLERHRFYGVELSNIRHTFYKYRKYPFLSTPESLLNVAGTQGSMLIIASVAGAEAGFLLLAMLIMAAPMALVGSSISLVFVSRAPGEHEKGNLAPYTWSIMSRLILFGAVPLTLISFLAPHLFPKIFGQEWVRTGEIIVWMLPWIAFQLVGSPVSMGMFVVGKQNRMLALTAFGVVIRVVSVLVAHNNNIPVVETFAISSGIHIHTSMTATDA